MLSPAMLLAPRLRTACPGSTVRGHAERNRPSVVDCEKQRVRQPLAQSINDMDAFSPQKSYISLQRFIIPINLTCGFAVNAAVVCAKTFCARDSGRMTANRSEHPVGAEH